MDINNSLRGLWNFSYQNSLHFASLLEWNAVTDLGIKKSMVSATFTQPHLISSAMEFKAEQIGFDLLNSRHCTLSEQEFD